MLTSEAEDLQEEKRLAAYRAMRRNLWGITQEYDRRTQSMVPKSNPIDIFRESQVRTRGWSRRTVKQINRRWEEFFGRPRKRQAPWKRW